MMKYRHIFIIVLSFILIHLPIIGPILQMLNTMYHEDGHAIVTLLTNGKVESISLFANTEGVTEIVTSSWLTTFFSGLAGYLFPSFILFIFLILWKFNAHKMILYILLFSSILNIILWVRNFYGLFWLALFSIFIIIVLKNFKSKTVLSYINLIILSTLLSSSIVSAFHILFLSFVTPDNAGDATALAQITQIDAEFWGLFFFAVTAFISFFSLKVLFFRKKNIEESNDMYVN